jgi:hypothetical protein
MSAIEETFWGTWAWSCPECGELFFVPVHASPVMYNRGKEPRRPEFDTEKFSCCGQIHEITPTNIEWVRVENYSPSMSG